MESLNERITKVLEGSGLTSSEFADEIEVQRSSVSHVTSGRNKPSLEFISKLRKRFPEISWDWLINGEGEMKKVDDKPNAQKKVIAPTDLFSLISDDNFGKENEAKSEEFSDAPKFENSRPNADKNQIAQSQQLENTEKNADLFADNSQKAVLQKIVMFYSNGKFVIYEP